MPAWRGAPQRVSGGRGSNSTRAPVCERDGAPASRCGVASPQVGPLLRPARAHQCLDTLDQFERGQHQADAAARSRLDALIDQVLGIDFTQPFQREGRPRAAAQQALQPLAVARFDAHAGIKLQAPAVIPSAHRRGVFALEYSAAGENAQQTVAHLGLNLGDGFGTDAPGFMKAHAACAIGLENAVDHDAVEMDVGIEQGAKAMDEGDGTDPGGWARPRGARAMGHQSEQAAQTVVGNRDAILELTSELHRQQSARLARDDTDRLLKHRVQFEILDKLRRICSVAEHMAISVLPRSVLVGELSL